MGEKGPPTVRAIVSCFLEPDRSVSGQEFPGLDRTGARPVTIGTGPELIGGPRLPGRGLLTQLTGHLLARLVGVPLDGGEVEVGGGTIGPEQVVAEHREKLLESGVLGRIGRRGAEHEGPP